MFFIIILDGSEEDRGGKIDGTNSVEVFEDIRKLSIRS